MVDPGQEVVKEKNPLVLQAGGWGIDRMRHPCKTTLDYWNLKHTKSVIPGATGTVGLCSGEQSKWTQQGFP